MENGNIDIVSENDAQPELMDRYIRLQADFDNYRKRIVREQEEFRKTAISDLAMDVIESIDVIDIALAHFDSDGFGENGIVDGVKLIKKSLIANLKKHGVEQMKNVTGSVFDPNVHEAVSSVNAGELNSGVVVKVTKPGYLVNGKLLRAAYVIIGR